MGHAVNKVLLGSSRSSQREVISLPGEIAAGKVVRIKSDGGISVASSEGSLIGISLGRTLSDITRTLVVYSGTQIPVLLKHNFNPTIGGQVYINDTNGLAEASSLDNTGTQAIYLSNSLTGINEDGDEVEAALIHMPGGL
jgi:hypothetical protein